MATAGHRWHIRRRRGLEEDYAPRCPNQQVAAATGSTAATAAITRWGPCGQQVRACGGICWNSVLSLLWQSAEAAYHWARPNRGVSWQFASRELMGAVQPAAAGDLTAAGRPGLLALHPLPAAALMVGGCRRCRHWRRRRRWCMRPSGQSSNQGGRARGIRLVGTYTHL